MAVRTVALLFLAVGVLALLANLLSADEAEEDAARVFCLSPAERDDLVDAAVALGLAQRRVGEQLVVADRELPLEAWRDERGSDFDRTCKALFTSRQRPQGTSGASGILATLAGLLQVAFGAAGALLVARWQNAIGRRQQQADALRSAADAFVSVAKTFIRAWTGTSGGPTPPDQDVHERRSELTRQLGRIVAVHPHRTAVLQLRTELSGGPLGEKMTREWRSMDKEERARELEAALHRLETAIGDIAHALEHPERARRARTANPQT